MNDANLIGVNIPNFITITIMAMVGIAVAGFVRKALSQRKGGGDATPALYQAA